MKWREGVAGLQTEFLNDLGIYENGYAPEGCHGKGRVVYRDADLYNRISWAGYQGATIRGWFSGNIAMTTRTMYRVAQAALGSYENRMPAVAMQVRTKSGWTT